MNTKENGIIKILLNGFGFITPQNNVKDVFFHKDHIGLKFESLRIGDYVTYNVVKSEKGPLAKNIILGAPMHDVLNFSRLSIKIRNGLLESFIELPNGTTIFPDGTAFDKGIYVFPKQNKWAKILKQLDILINDPCVKESELQDFFEENPELMLDEKFDNLIPQATIIGDDKKIWKPDFILTPIDQVSFAKIIELKLPTEKISLKPKSGHHNFSHKLIKAIRQLKDYHEAFSSHDSTIKFKEKYQVDIYKPDLQLLFGRRNSITNTKEFLNFQKSMNVEITNWDSYLDELKRKFN